MLVGSMDATNYTGQNEYPCIYRWSSSRTPVTWTVSLPRLGGAWSGPTPGGGTQRRHGSFIISFHAAAEPD